MSQFAEPTRTPAPKAPDRHGPEPATATPARCLGAAAQLAAVHRTLAGGPPVQLRTVAAAGRRADVAADAKPQTANRTGLPDRVKAGVEALSGLAMDDVRVHRDSPEPARLGALAYTQGSNIHLGPGQEHHLPHEAWHVVQQKQGRVKATTQLKGVEVNKDSVLESEADMFASGFPFPLPAPCPRLRQGAQSHVAQRMLKVGTRDVPAEDVRHSPILTEMNDDTAAIYVLPDAWTPDTPKDETYVLDGNRRYLLGEEHRTSTFDADTMKWTSVPKISEAYVEFPDRPEQYNPAGGAPNTLALESTHLHLLNATLLVHDMANDLGADDGKHLWKLNFTVLDELGHWMGDMLSIAKRYTRYVNDPNATAFQPADPFVAQLEKKLSTLYVPGITDLANALRHAVSIVPPRFPIAAHLNIPEGDPRIAAANDIVAQAKGLVPLITELTEFLKVPEGSQEAAAIAAHSGETPYTKDQTNTVLKERRDQGMAAKIKAVPAPNLVRLGDAHVDRVAELVEASAVPVHHPKKIDQVSSLDFWESR